MAIGLEVGLKALFASRSTLDTIGHNISNANTAGYSRQSLELSAAPTQLLKGLAIGSGVNMDLVRRTSDDLLTKRLVTQHASLQRLQAKQPGLSEVETILGEPGAFGISALLDDFFAQVSSLASNPGDSVQRAGMVNAAGSLTGQFNQLFGGMQDIRADVGRRIVAEVDQVNELAQQIVGLNLQIGEVEAAGVPANDQRDQRDLLLKELGGKIDLQYLEDESGTVQVFASNQLLIGPTRAYEMSSEVLADGSIELTIDRNPHALQPKGGAIGGLVELADQSLPAMQERLDTIALNLAFEFNRVHSTGVPQTGPYRQLTGQNELVDTDGDGSVLDERLAHAGLPFDLQDGTLYVNVNQTGSAEFRTTAIDIDTARTTVQDLLDEFNSIPGMTAHLDGSGRLVMRSQGGYRFDFSSKLNRAPDPDGTFGGGQASLGTGGGQPYALAPGATLDLVGPSSAFSVAFDVADFEDITEATAEEIVDALNQEAAMQTNGLRAVVVGERVAIQTIGEGTTESFTVSGGTSLGALGLTAGTTVTGHSTSVGVEIGGAYTGASNESFLFIPTSDGTIGTTPGLEVEVYDSAGQLVNTIEVGEDYVPGTPLDVIDGMTVSLGFGEISATDNDSFSLNALADSDTSDALVALGVNALFVGTSASDIALREDIEVDPDLIATSLDGSESDNTKLLEMLGLEGAGADGLNGETLGDFYSGFVGDIGLEVSTTESARAVEQVLLDGLEDRREQISGVNIDEELVRMIQFEQAFATASQYIQVVNSLNDELLNIL